MSVRPALHVSASPRPEPRPHAKVTPPGPVAEPPEVQTAKSRRASTRVGKRGAVVWLEPEAIRQLGKMAIDEETTVQALMAEAVDGLFRARGKHRL